MSWFYLLLAGLCEIAFTTFIKLSDNFTRVGPSIAFFVLAFCSFFALSLSLRTIPLGTAYAIWTGIGAFGTALIGIAFFGEPTDFWRLFFLVCLISSIIGLKLAS